MDAFVNITLQYLLYKQGVSIMFICGNLLMILLPHLHIPKFTHSLFFNS